MLRLLSVAVLITVAVPDPVHGRVGPEIAYSLGTEIYLVNPDGTGKVRIYRSKGNSFISSVSLKPGGGGIAFVDDWALKFLSYDSAGRPVGTVRTITGCYRLSEVQYHPSGESVLYEDFCNNENSLKQVAVPTASNPNPTPTTVVAAQPEVALLESGWDPSGTSFVYSLSGPTGYELRRQHLNGANELILSRNTAQQIRYPDVSNSGAGVVISDWHMGNNAYPNGTIYTSEVNAVDGSALQVNFIQGVYARYSPNDQRIVYIVPANNWSGRTLRIRNSDGSHNSLGGKGPYHSVDWGR